MKKLINKLKKSESASVFKGMMTLAMGSSAARIIGFASVPVVTRIYSPGDFGVLALFISFVSILVPFATLKYSTAIPLPKTDGMALNILVLGLLLIATLSVIIGTSLLLFGDTILSWFNAMELAQWWWLIVLGIAGTASYELFSLWSIRKRKYKTIAKTDFAQSLTGNAAKIALGLLALKPFGLILGQFLGQSSGVGGLIKGSLQDFKINFSSISTQRIRFVAVYYRQFPYFRLPSQLLLSFSAQAPIFMMAALFSKDETGQLSLAMMAVALPAGVIGGAMAKAFYAEIAAVGKNDLLKIKRLTVSVQKKLFLIGMPLAVLTMLLAEPMFQMVFGQEWRAAGKYAAILAPFVFLQFTSNPLMQVLNIAGSQLMFLLINLVRLVGLMALFFSVKAFFLLDAIVFVITLSAYLTLYYLVMTVLIIFIVNSSVRKQVVS